MSTNGFLLGNITLPIDSDEADAFKIAANEMKRAGLDTRMLHFRLYKKSVDARKKNNIKFVYTILAAGNGEMILSPDLFAGTNIRPFSEEQVVCHPGSEKSEYPPLVAGMGPAGLFSALLLAENGYKPVIIDRGADVRTRSTKVAKFVADGSLDTECNIQFGAGGAGTFSDGKLLTRINDGKINYILKRLVSFGAPEEILTQAKPHIGTDLLVGVTERALETIESLGGKVIYNCRLDDFTCNPGGFYTAVTTIGKIAASGIILAVGHSARDTYEKLLSKGMNITAKPFSVGVRIEHLQQDIDHALYGKLAGDTRLPKGEYHLSDTGSGRGVYTFCMCPGGTVVAAASENGGVVTNGMSNYARNGKNANSAVAVTIRCSDYGDTPMKAIEFQRALERSAYEFGGKNYNAPAQTVGNFLGRTNSRAFGKVMPSYRGGNVTVSDFKKILPDFVSDELRRGLLSFNGKLPGFAADYVLLTGTETRTSSPVRIVRGEDMCAAGYPGIYPAGEGAGYAGGITSSAVDGIKAAQAYISRFAPCK